LKFLDEYSNSKNKNVSTFNENPLRYSKRNKNVYYLDANLRHTTAVGAFHSKVIECNVTVNRKNSHHGVEIVASSDDGWNLVLDS
jgi:hypothetical protein